MTTPSPATTHEPARWNYPAELPVVEHREEIIAAIRENPVVVVVSDTGSGKTTQLPKMVAEALGPAARKRIGCTQPRRLAAVSVAKRVAEELAVPLGQWVGYQVRFDDKTSRQTRVKFMTDGILLAETQGDPELRQYDALIIDEAHERSLNIDFLLGWIRRLMETRSDLKIVISSATLDAGAFATFFGSETRPAPVIEAPGRMFPVAEFFQPPPDDDDLPQSVARAVDFLTDIEPRGDILVFLPGEREIRECADVLEGRRWPATEVLPLFARLSLGDQQRVFNPGHQRRLILATNVAETSLTIPRISCVIDTGLARVSRWSPGRGVQRLHIEPVSRASARQRKGRCGRVRDGVCIRLYGEDELTDRAEFTDPEIRRSSLAGVILRMKFLGLPEITDFPFLDAPAPKAIAEGYRTLREVGALDRDGNLTDDGRRIARLPVDPRFGKMLLEAQRGCCLAEVLPIIAALETSDVRERPADKTREADAAHARWKDAESDFLGILRLWLDLAQFREKGGGQDPGATWPGRPVRSQQEHGGGLHPSRPSHNHAGKPPAHNPTKPGRWRSNALRKFAAKHFLNFRRILEWANVCDELTELLEREWKWKVPTWPGPPALGLPAKANARKGARQSVSPPALAQCAAYDAIHRALLAGAPRQFGLWDRENKAYRSASGGFFSIFPGSGVFNTGKRHDWVMAMELVETSRLYARRVARIDPEWIEHVAPHLCRSKYGEAFWDVAQGAVYGKETVICGGLHIIAGRRVHYGRVDPKAAHNVFLRDGILGGGLRRKTRFLGRIEELREQVADLERKLRRPGGLWSDDAVLATLEARIPGDIHTAAAFHKWLAGHEDAIMLELADVLDESPETLGIDGLPDAIHHEGHEYTVYYNAAPGERDDGVTLGVHVDQLPAMPEWLPQWGVDGHLAERVEILLRAMPKDYRRICQPLGPLAEGFASLWRYAPKDRAITAALVDYLLGRRGAGVPADAFDFTRLPDALVTKIWVCDDDGEELALDTSVATLKLTLADRMRSRFEAAATGQVERTGMSAWDGEALPASIDTPGGAAWPALVDEGGSVGIRAFTCEAEAGEAHRQGGARLLIFGRPEQAKWLAKKFPLGMKTRVELPRLGAGGTTLDDLLLLAAEGAAGGGPFPRSPDAIRNLAETSRAHWHDAASQIGEALEESLEILPEIRRWIDKYRNDRNHAPIAADLDAQLAWLFRPRFAWRAGFSRLCDYPRRLRAIRSRLGRIASLPLIKDLEKLDRLHPHWQPWHEMWTAAPDASHLWAHGWMLEEFRVALFAPDVPTVAKVSEKRLQAALEGFARP